MHIPDGILPATVVAGGYAATGVATWYSLRKINEQEDARAGIPKAALLTSAFFVASWIHIPVPPTSVHLVLNGLLGVLLGWYAFPAILIGLLFQAIMFQHGGLTTLGINAMMMGVPALVAFGLFNLRHRFGWEGSVAGASFGFVGSAAATALSVLIFYGLLIATLPTNLDAAAERTAIAITSLAYLPVLLIEATMTAILIVFLMRVKPAMIDSRPPSSRSAAAGAKTHARINPPILDESSEAARA